MKMKSTAVMLALVAAVAQPRPAAAAITVNYALRGTLGFQADGDPTLGNGGDAQTVFLNLAPRALIEFNPDWAGYIRGRAFVPSGSIQPFDSGTPNNATGRTRSFVGLSELWLQYNGLTSYPGEAVSFGRQHVRQIGNEWFDEDLDSARWLFDTTLRNIDVGVAHQFSTYRSDDAPIIAEQRRRTYLFGNLALQWLPGQRVGTRVVHAIDNGHAPDVGSAVTGNSKLRNSQLSWIGVYADNGFYDALGREKLNYWIEFNSVIGDQTVANPGAGNIVATRAHENVTAYSGTGGGRWRPFTQVPISLGALYTYSSGGGGAGHSHQYQQTGVQSNASTFAGTQTLINRYNETLRAELGNLRIATGFVALNFDNDDVAAVFSNFSRNDGGAPIVTDNVTAATVNNGADIGNGFDVVATHYFGRVLRRQRLLSSGDAFVSQERRSLISIRASAFAPGSAYGPNSKTDYRVLLEATLWLN